MGHSSCARRRPSQVLGEATQAPTYSLPSSPPLLTVIVPTYNEAETVHEVLSRVTAVHYSMQIIIVDDGSTDGTADVLATWHGRPGVLILRHDRNRGKGSAIRTALPHAEGRFTIIQDADLECDPEDFPQLIEPLVSGRAQVVYGSRYLRPRRTYSLHRVIYDCGVFGLNLLVRFLYGARITDEATCYKVFPTTVLCAMELECEGFEFCPEATAKACRLGLAIHEVPIGYSPRSIEAGKKLRFRDGLRAIRTLWKWRKWNGKSSRGAAKTPTD